MHPNVQVTATEILVRTGKNGSIYRHNFTGTFITRDGALLVVPPGARRPNMSKVGRDTEKKMLKVLFSTNLYPLNPRSDPSLAGKCETRDGTRSAFSRLLKASGTRFSGCTQASPAIDRRFDCLLLVGGPISPKVGRKQSDCCCCADVRQHEGANSVVAFASFDAVSLRVSLESSCSPRPTAAYNMKACISRHLVYLKTQAGFRI